MKSPHACVEKERLFAYASRMLDGGEEGQVKLHLDACAACREVVAGFQKLDRVLEEWKPVDPSPWFDARARAHVSSREGRAGIRFPRLPWRVWAGAVAVAILVGVTSVAVFRPRHPSISSRSQSIAAVKPVAPSPGPVAPRAPVDTATVAQAQPAKQEIDLYKNLSVLENYDMLANFDVLSELPPPGGKTSD